MPMECKLRDQDKEDSEAGWTPFDQFQWYGTSSSDPEDMLKSSYHTYTFLTCSTENAGSNTCPPWSGYFCSRH